MRNLPQLLRAAERRVNAHVWPNRLDNQGADAHLASIPANRDTDADLLLIEAADRIEAMEKLLRESQVSIGRDWRQRRDALVGADPNAPFRWICPHCNTVSAVGDAVCLGCGQPRYPLLAAERRP